ncbi:phage holin family protein [Mycobacterium sp. SM1]|uniref:phage holin family protein n=1 Tax=Mycobacterium sp. SM1 TaxID=2816243 RepID=UPI001BCE325C|nr:phage holin family protein [Mycobacterium sp. SM1]MBS4727738.1 phage holin family protein [Mycobacterium sp. SM1]
MSKADRKNADSGSGNAARLTTIPLADPHATAGEPSIGDLVKEASAQVSTLVRAEVELARAEITRDLKKGLAGSVFFIAALVVLCYSTFFFFFFLAELLHTWLWQWLSFLIVFGLMLVVTALLALVGFLKVRRIRGPRRTIESVKEARTALSPGHDRVRQRAPITPDGKAPADPAGW